MKKFDFRKNNFDLIRLLAALQVVVIHGYEHFGIEGGKWFINLLSIFPGVPIFFVISGFLISASFERTESLYYYFQNRFLRIYPALWGCFIFSILTVFTAYSPDMNWVDFFKWILAQTTIGQFYNPEFLRDYGIGVLNGSLWTIPVELQFYMVLPLLYFFLKKIRWNKVFILTFIIFLIVINQSYIEMRGSHDSLLVKLFSISLFPYLYIFLIGVVLQRNLSFVKKYLADRLAIWLGIFLTAVVISSYTGLNYSGNYLNPMLALLISFLTVSMAYSNTSLSNVLKGNDISYGVYIYHMVYVNFLINREVFLPEMNLIIMVISTVITALISWKMIEKPALSLKKNSGK